MELLIDPRKVAWIQCTILAFLTFAHIVSEIFILYFGRKWVFGLVPMFNLGYESNIPTFFSTLQLVLSATLLLIISFSQKEEKIEYYSHWLCLSFIFTS